MCSWPKHAKVPICFGMKQLEVLVLHKLPSGSSCSQNPVIANQGLKVKHLFLLQSVRH